MNKCSVSKNPHLICNRLIISKVSCFDVKASWWGCFKGVSSLSDLCLAGNVDALLDDVTSLGSICLIPDSDSLSDEIIIAFYAIRTRSPSLIAYIRTCSCYLIVSLLRNVSPKSSLAWFIICIKSVQFKFWFLSGWNWRARER